MAEVRLEHLVKRFDSVPAVEDMSLTVGSGEFISLVGPSGCGKTTTLNLIAGFLAPDAGNIFIDGERLNDVPIYKRKMGMVFQSYALFPHMTVLENIAFGLRMQKAADAVVRREVGRALELVRLPGVEQRYPRQLSGGQQQRIALARALVINPRVLLLDEPLSNLDAQLRKEMRIELRDIQKAVGITAIFVTHDQEEALSLSDRLAVMYRGRIEQVGTPIEIYETPRTEFVNSFIGETNLLAVRVLEVQDGTAQVDFGGQRMPVRLGDTAVSAGDLLKIAIRPEKIGIRPAAGPAGLWVAGTVEHAVFIGNMTYYRVKAGGQMLAVLSQNLDARTFPPGAPVQLGFQADVCRPVGRA
jgi:ABC-type Fe3+/spermidine/putrescine transport system ATPase subunit